METLDVQSIEGWLTTSEAVFLNNQAKNIALNSVIVEIGSWKGKSTIAMARGLRDKGFSKIYAIDPHSGSKEHLERYGKVNTFQDFLDNLEKFKVRDLVIPVKSFSIDSVEVVKESIGFLFIDGAHDFKNIRNDFEAWFEKVIPNGGIGFHDSWHAFGVQLATTKFLLLDKKLKNPKLIDTLTYAQKTNAVTSKEILENIFFVIYRFLFGWIGTIKMDFGGDTVGRFKHI